MVYLTLDDDELHLIKQHFPELFRKVQKYLVGYDLVVNSEREYDVLDDAFTNDIYKNAAVGGSNYEWTDEEWWLEDIYIRVPEYVDD